MLILNHVPDKCSELLKTLSAFGLYSKSIDLKFVVIATIVEFNIFYLTNNVYCTESFFKLWQH